MTTAQTEKEEKMSRETGVSPECPTCGHDSEHYDVPGVHACEACEQGADDAAEEYAGEDPIEKIAYTPGPWRAIPDPRGWTLSNDRAQDVTAEAFDCSEANARLIAAAPSLYEALRALRDSMQTFEDADDTRWTDEDQAALEQARAAIKAAEGE